MTLAFGLNFADLNNLQGLKKLDNIFLNFLCSHNHSLYQIILSLRANPEQVNQKYYSDFLLEISPILDDFLAELFAIEQEIANIRFSHKEFDLIYECKRKFVQRIAVKKYPYEKLQEIDFTNVSNSLKKLLGIECYPCSICHPCESRDIDSRLRGNDKGVYENDKSDFTNKFARQVMEWQLDAEKYAFELDIAAKYAAFMVYNNVESQLFSLPQKIDKDNLIDHEKVAKYRNNARIGFDYLDSTSNLDVVLNNTHYCIYCHKQEKDSCSKGLLSAIYSNQKSMLSKSGCPLKQKISEMNYVKSKGFNLAALAIIIIDNPMVAATGHRICNDCSNACIYQKQQAVDIPLVESNILGTTLLLPYGVEIYLLLTNWNPLNIFAPLPNLPTNYKVLVVGQGPAGFSLSHYLLRDGHDVVAIDGLKITPLPFDVNQPIKYWSDYKKNLSERIPGGFGGVAEYGITPRWDKNNLTILRLMLQRNSRFKIFGSVSLDSNITMEQVYHLGFDHVALCTGAAKPKIVEMRNFLAKGVRTASDFLMTLQSGGAFLEQSITNLLIRMPIIIIGGGLTAIDAATESLNYYKLQVEKFLKNYQLSVVKNGKKHTEQHWTNEDRLIAEEFILHAKLFKQAQTRPSIKQILDELGGVTICYRGKLKDSPSYKLNPEEVMYAMGDGVKFVEDMIPLGIDVDQYNYTQSIEFDNLGVRKKFKARTVLMAIGIDKEVVNNHLEDIVNSGEFVARSDGATPITNRRATSNNVPNFSSIDYNVTYFGDCNPLYSGSVVKAIASSKEGYKNIGEKLTKNSPIFPGSYIDFFAKLDYLLTSRIEEVNILSDKIVELVIHSPLAAKNFQPGQFFRLQNYSSDIAKIIEPLAIAGAYVDSKNGLIHLIVWQSGKSSNLCRYLSKNEQVVLMGPNGKPTEILKDSNIVLIGGGVGNAVLCSIAKALKNNNCKIIYFAGYKNLQDRFYQEKIEESADIVVWCCEEGILSKNRSKDISVKGNLLYAIMGYCSLWENLAIDRIIAAGVSEMMQAIRDKKDDFFGKKPQLIVSINSPMQCMMKGICGQCIQKITDKNRYIFTCTCQEQDAKIVDFIGLKSRLEQNSLQEKL
ncbi:palindromic element RPE2 domain-containing protein [Rickettsia endosymbiont of Culicoides newsteadi]|uniref:palindromic element RPE2 domain-containing protein n=1 Tax=Rickettsia endosymbiont of Culicoides newsteadi TaxID=1961830 RepID=UPI000B9BEFAE|nr:palindromic element RPE2 domain-containing protein [Rickettsia endosymbiont of Culicoides newsteadi]OZG31981.1 2-polyprenylphenol hydroxylase [Rickettsia endosymbiont of Culicoides newsteadi]